MSENDILREAIEVYKGTISTLSAARAEDQEKHRKEVDALNARIMELTAQVAWLKRRSGYRGTGKQASFQGISAV